jgi:predicted transglutaminase-like cysteine proteinase
MKTLQDFQELHKKVFALFKYEYDERNYGVMEDWRSHASLVNEGKQFVDDCDGYAFTMCELMLEQGYPKDKVMFIVCETETGEGHAVCGFETDGVTYIAENRFRYVYDWKSKPDYVWKFFMKFDKPGQWFQVTND